MDIRFWNDSDHIGQPFGESSISLPLVELHGVNGVDELYRQLVDKWMPLVKSPTNILNILVEGITPVRTVTKVGGSIVDLVALPISEKNMLSGIKSGIDSFAGTNIKPALQAFGSAGHLTVKHAIRPTVLALMVRDGDGTRKGFRAIPILVIDHTDKLCRALSQTQSRGESFEKGKLGL